MKLASFNVWDSPAGMPHRREQILLALSSLNADVLCLQEVSCTTWMSCLKEGIGDTPALLDTYDFVGTIPYTPSTVPST